jgi:hypothetical protein
MRKRKAKVIDIPIDKQMAARKILESKFFLSKHNEINVNSGFCCYCGSYAQKILRTDVSDADDDGHKIFRVERFCDSCYQRWVVEVEKKSESK